MTETGVVVSVDGENAKISVDKKDECVKCGLCVLKEGVGQVEFTAFNSVGAEVGDTVTIERRKTNLFSVMLAFLIPLILIGVSVLLNYTLIKWEPFILIFSIGTIAIWYFILAVADKKFRNSERFSTRVTGIIKKQGDNYEQQS